MNKEKFFSILVPHRLAAPAVEAEWNKDQQMPFGKQIDVHPVGGPVILPNYSNAWATRGMKDGKPTGVLKFMEWGTSDSKGEGEAVEIRYLPNCKSLDKGYQESVLKLKVSKENAVILLTPGVNDFEITKHPMLIEMLKYHTANGSNSSRNPDATTVIYSEYEGKEVNKNRMADHRERGKIMDLIIDAIENKHIIALANLFEIDVRHDEHVIHEKLMDLAEEPGIQKLLPGWKRIQNVVEDFKKNSEASLRTSVEMGLLISEENSEIAVLSKDGKNKVPFIKGVVQQGDSTVQFIMDHILEEEYYDAFIKLEGTLIAAKALQFN